MRGQEARRQTGKDDGGRMRYRRLSSRYALVLAPREPRAFGDPWRSGRAGTSVSACYWRPRADLVESSGGYHLTVDLAGVDPEAFEVLVFQDAVVIEGER